MRRARSWLMGSCALLLVAGCGDETGPERTLSPPGALDMVAGPNTVLLGWERSGFDGANDFRGYNIYVDVASIPVQADAFFLASRLANQTPTTSNLFTVSMLTSGASLQQGTAYYFQVRTVHANGGLSAPSNEVHTAPRPEGNNGSDASQFMYDDDSMTATKSGYGWDSRTGQGVAYSRLALNDSLIDVLMVEEPNSADDGSFFVAPSESDLAATWITRNATLFKDLGAGPGAWETAIAPDPSSMTPSVKLQHDHTYAIRTHDRHWVKLRVNEIAKNVEVARIGGGSARLNYARFTFAVQLIQDYGRF